MRVLRDNAHQFQQHVISLGEQGDPELYLSGYAHHGRNTYTQERIAELNEKAWGVGYGKTAYNARGNEESVYLLVIDDSHGRPQPMLGYAYQWTWSLEKSALEVGAGYTAMLMSRADYYGGIPFPVVLPVASFGTRKYRLMASYVPRLSQNKGNGDVLLVFLRIAI
ncbi:MAG: crcA [Herminiimonas sp.]|nr:crcA [Herminiimonas sp.]